MTAAYFALLFPLGFADRAVTGGEPPAIDCGPAPAPSRCQSRRVRLAERVPVVLPLLRERPCSR